MWGQTGRGEKAPTACCKEKWHVCPPHGGCTAAAACCLQLLQVGLLRENHRNTDLPCPEASSLLCTATEHKSIDG